jgi:hypothetical protein
MFKFTEASKSTVKLKLALMGASGSGKTMSALRLAFGITNDWNKIGIIDTENRSSLLYARLGKFKHLHLQPPYSPERYIQAIEAAEEAGIECLIIDSASHEWSGTGGCLDINERLATELFRGNTWSAWSETKPRHQRFIQKFLQSDMHIISCVRTKTETQQVNGKVIKVGTKEIQSDEFEYEFTTVFLIDKETHFARVTKDRTGIFDSEPFLITEKTGKDLMKWCEDADIQTVSQEQLQTFNTLKDFTEELKSFNITSKSLDIIANTPIRDNTEYIHAEQTLTQFSKELTYLLIDTALNTLTDAKELDAVKKFKEQCDKTTLPEETIALHKRAEKLFTNLLKPKLTTNTMSE